METVTVRFQENILKKVDKSIEHHDFNSRTEFIREAVRDKIAELDKEELIKRFLNFRGKATKKTTYKENRRTRNEVSKELIEELEKRFT